MVIELAVLPDKRSAPACSARIACAFALLTRLDIPVTRPCDRAGGRGSASWRFWNARKASHQWIAARGREACSARHRRQAFYCWQRQGSRRRSGRRRRPALLHGRVARLRNVRVGLPHCSTLAPLWPRVPLRSANALSRRPWLRADARSAARLSASSPAALVCVPFAVARRRCLSSASSSLPSSCCFTCVPPRRTGTPRARPIATSPLH